ncbi:MAG: hypothetical protein IT383_21290 [Deltaproteobacteria bacterium]|nr:hypothetical protein [Deltaproteobacteria bacterium]
MAVDGVKGGGKESIYGLMADGLDLADDAFNPEKQLKKAGNIAGQLGDAVKGATGGGGGGGGLFGGGGGGLLGGIMNIAKMVLSVVCPAAGIALNLVSGLMNSQGGGGGGGGMGNDILGSVANGVLGGVLGG